MTDKELMQLALYALGLAKSSHNMVLSSDPPQSAWRYYDVDMKLQETITALDKRLAQPEQELVTGNLLKDAYNAMVEKKTRGGVPPLRPWAGLTDEEVKDFQVNKFIGPNLIRAIERRLKEKNS